MLPDLVTAAVVTLVTVVVEVVASLDEVVRYLSWHSASLPLIKSVKYDILSGSRTPLLLYLILTNSAWIDRTVVVETGDDLLLTVAEAAVICLVADLDLRCRALEASFDDAVNVQPSAFGS